MPKTVKVDPYERFQPYVGRKFLVRFGKHGIEDPTELVSVGKQNTTGFNLAPEKRMVDGKNKTPELFALQFSDFKLVFVAEDAVAQTSPEGITITCGPYTVECRMVNSNEGNHN